MRFQQLPGKGGLVRAILLPFLVLDAGGAYALGLGEIALHSRLGAPLLADIRLIETAGSGKFGEECFRLAGGDAAQEIPVLRQAHLHVEQRNGQSYLVIRSGQPVDEPALQLNVRVGCGSELERRYTLLIDPGDAPEAPAVVPAAGHAAGPGSSGSSVPGSAVAPTGGEARRTARAGRTGDSALTDARPARKAASKPAFGGKLADRLVIAAEPAPAESSGPSRLPDEPAILNLRPSTELSVDLTPSASEDTRAALRMEYKLRDALAIEATQPLDLATQMRQLETRLEELKAAYAAAPQGADAATSNVDLPVAGEPAPASGVRPRAPEPAVDASGSGWWPGLLVFLLCAAGLAVWLARRHRTLQRARSVAVDTPPASSVAATTAAPDPLDDGDAGIDVTVPPLRHLEPLDFVLDAPHDRQPAAAAPEPAVEVRRVEEVDDSATVLELAEIMVSFGRIQGAAQALAEYLESHPETSVAPWLRLLEIYRMNDMPAEFATCSAQLRKHFNVAPASWDEAGAYLGQRIAPANADEVDIDSVLKRLPAIGALPHVRDSIVRMWDSAEAVAYLQHLFRDTRNGQRTGFPLTIARELLFLLDLQESRLRRRAA